ncbi:uncharacterized protein [Parasteatoda tepidariorum]|uniref:uncharacterized protein n=1 Tax=Parasteatoda tepidariorum TaxID=114398 RepID=UPI001C71E881|nr:uncharacterized protein LOC107447036 [Parasteatoda tepidariorum]
MSDDKESPYPVSKTKQERYFLTRFENDVQIIFDKMCFSKNIPSVKVNLLMRRGILYLKADYILPLKSFESPQLNCEELVFRLKTINYLLDVEIDSNFNLTFGLKRPDVYKIVLDEVTNFNCSYGMSEKNNVVLVLVDNDEVNDFIRTRNNLLAHHIISLLSANKAEVYYSGCSFLSKHDILNASEVKCLADCDLDYLCDQMRDKLNVSEWRKECETEGSLCIDAKEYLEKNVLLDKYGKDINSIIVPDLNDKLFKKVASIKHLISNHIKDTPDVILYIAFHGVNRAIWKMGILLQILEKPISIKSYIFNQSVKINVKEDFTFDNYVLHHKNGVEKAMTEKYNIDVCQDKVWSSRIEKLIDSAVKFDFLKLSPNMSLKLDLSNCHSTEKNSGIFVQYNFARLSNLFSKFETKVKEGYYEPLKALEDVDFSLLRLEEEWNLFQYVVSFPKLINRVLDCFFSESNLKTRYPVNGICVMLTELCHYLSLYYSKIRILAGPQKHLQILMNARLWLLKGIYRVMLNSFVLLDIQGLDVM